MASFPVVVTTSSGSNNLTTSHTVTMPSSIVAGRKLLVFFTTEGATGGTTNTPSGWTKEAERVEDSGAELVRLVVYSKTAAGSDTLTVTTSGSVDSAYTCYQIASQNAIRVATAVDGDSANPNPPSLTPAGGSQKYLWIAATAFQSGTVSSYPTNYSSSQLTNTAENFKIASAVYALETTVQDPGTYTVSISGRWVAITVAIEQQDTQSATFTLITQTSSLFVPSINFAGDGNFSLIVMTSSILAPTATAGNNTVWTNETRESTTWTNESL